MGNIHKKYDAAFKAKVALEAVKAEKTIRELSSEYGVHPNQIMKWKQQLLEELPSIFSKKRAKFEQEKEELEAELYRQIGQLKVELEWLKKNLSCSANKLRGLIEPMNPKLPISRQCELIGLPLSSYSYEAEEESEYNLLLMRLIDEQ